MILRNRKLYFLGLLVFICLQLLPLTTCTAESETQQLNLTKEDKTWLAKHPQITVAVNHGWMPIEFLSEGNELRGISVDYLMQLEKVLGIHFKKISSAENPAIETADMLSAVVNVNSLKDSRFVPLDKPYLNMPFAIFSREDNQDIHRLEDLDGKTVAVFKTGAVAGLLVQQHPKIRLYKADIAEEALAALMEKKVDAYIGNQYIVSYVAKTQGFKTVKLAGETPYSASITMAVRNDWPEFKVILQKGLNSLEGQQHSILQNWTMNEDYSLDYRSALAIGGVLTALVLVFSYKSWRLNKEIYKSKKLSQELIWEQANFDFLTKLPNRRMFQERLEQELKKSDRTGLPLALLSLDLDQFKEVNDGLGHSMGDLLLIEAAKRLNECIRTVDVVARIGGDEFTLILGELKDANSVERVSDDILHQLAQPFQLKDEVVYISTSIGITFYPDDATEIDTLLKNADQAMYAAKGLGRNRYQYFTASMQEAAQVRMRITNDLRTAITENQFLIYYQPIVELTTGNIHKAEALIRWQHPVHGLINPAQFITIAEDTGMIIPISNWVFQEVAIQLSQWRESYYPEFQISINRSPIQFKSDGSALAWINLLREKGIPGQGICIEITEGLLLDASVTVIEQLSDFRNAGIEIAIDDFGTGYSSLAYLKKFEIDYVKIDRSFVNNIESDSNDRVLCEAIISMAHKLGFKVVAEGIETAEQENFLRQVGCDYGQGYYFAKPAPVENFESYLNSR